MKPRGARWAKLGLVLTAFVMLTAARLSVSVPPQIAVPDMASVKLHTPFTAKVGDTLMTAKVFDIDRVTTSNPFHAKISRFEQQLDAGTELTTVIVPETAHAITGVDSQAYYCGSDLRVRSGFADMMVGDMFSKWESIVRFCFVDTDDDSKFDHMIIAGAKDKTFQQAVTIEPLAYTKAQLVRDKGNAELRLVMRKLDPRSGKVDLDVQLWRDGKEQTFDYLLCGLMRKDGFLPPSKCWSRFQSNPRKRPYPAYFNDVLGGVVSVSSIDAQKGEAQIVIDRPFSTVMFKPISIQYQVIYIYI